MKLLKIALCLAVMSITAISSVSAATYENGSVIQDELGYIEIPEDSSYIKFELPQGTYPSGSKAVIYAQENVYCFIPGLDYEEPTPDKNPYKLAAEYTFTEEDIANLSNGNTLFTTTLKFDIMCGSIKITIVESAKKPTNNLVDDNREQGSTESEEGVKLDVYADGSTFASDVKYENGILTFIIPQGSYTLGDYIVITKDDAVVENITITKDMMNTLVNNNIEYPLITQLSDANNIKFMISSYIFEKDDQLEIEGPANNGGTNEEPSEPSEGLNPLVVGGGTFLVVLLVGGLVMYFTSKKKKPNKPRRIEDNRIIDVESTDKE